MIIVTARMELDPADVETAKAAAIVMMDETAKEDGCIFYRFHADLEHPGRFLAYEEWESVDALRAHMAAPHMATWRGVLGGLTVLSREIKIFEAGPAVEL